VYPNVYPEAHEKLMARTLTTAAVRNLRPTNRRRIIRDGGATSLYLVIQPSGRKSWMMRFRGPSGKVGKIVLGPVDLSGRRPSGEPPEIGEPLSLVAARQVAADVHSQRARKRDVVADHKARKHRQRAGIVDRAASTFDAVARTFVEEHMRGRVRRWREVAKALGFIYPPDGGEPVLARNGLAARWGDRDVASIDASDLHAVIEETRRNGIPGIPARAAGPNDSRARVMARALSSFFSWCVRNRRIEVKPTIHIPAQPRNRERVLTEAEIKAVWRAVDRVSARYAAVVKLLLLTGCRLREISELKWSEIAADCKTLSIPGARTKNHRAHLVPLAPSARRIIAAQPRQPGNEFVFTAGNAPIGNYSDWKKKLNALTPGVASWCVHDLRRTAVTHMVEMGEQPHVVELCVNHAGGHRRGVAGVYNRAEMMDERRAALVRWAVHVRAIVSGRRRS